MAAFLLWNVNKKPLDDLVLALVRQLQIDVVMLVEYAGAASQLHRLMFRDGLIRMPSPKRFGVFTRAGHGLTRLKYRLGSRAVLWNWVPPSGVTGNLVLLHGLDRRNCDDSTRRVFFHRVADAVRRRESQCGHRRSLVMGDFNAQPFEPAVVDCDGLHAIGVRAVRTRDMRAVQGTDAKAGFFYNPMWRAYGHRQHPEAGAASHFWLGRRAHELGWFMLDQVVLRPAEIARFPESELRIVTQIGAISLLNLDGVPDKNTASDHLPIVFRWDL